MDHVKRTWSMAFQRRRTQNLLKEQDPIYTTRQMESLSTNPHTVKLNPNCSGQAHSSRPGTSYGYESTEPE